MVAAPPELSAIPNQIVAQGAPPLAVPFTLSAPLPQEALLNVTSSRPEFARAGEIVGSGTNRVLRIQVSPIGPVGNVTFTLAAYDQEATNQVSFVLTVQPAEFLSANLTTPRPLLSASWADFTGDGLPDLIGFNHTQGPATPFENLGGRSLASFQLPESPILVHTIAWTDFDGDGALEVLVMGFTQARLYRTEAAEDRRFVEITQTWPFHGFTGAAWADFDGDGDEDLVMTGQDAQEVPGPAALLRNDGGAELVPMNTNLPTTRERPVAGDFNNDGLPDVLLFNIENTTASGVWLNQSDGEFSPSPLTLTPAISPVTLDRIHNAGALDFDGNGQLDVWLVQESPRSPRFHEMLLWRQISGRFELHLKIETEDIRGAYAPAWSDFDGDGRLDFVVPRLGPELYASSRATTYQQTNYLALHRNQGDGNFLPGGYLWPATFGTPAAGDFNRDGLMDLWAPGVAGIGSIVTNAMRVANPPPDAPAGLRAFAFNNDVLFLWNEARDPNQATPLTYNLRVGTRRGANDVVPSLSLADGTRLLPAQGNSGFTSFRLLTLERAPSERLFWSVQAVDNGFIGSTWAPEQEVLLRAFANRPPRLVGLTNFVMTDNQNRWLTFSVLDDLTHPAEISVSATSSNPNLLSVTSGELPQGASPINRLVQFIPRQQQQGQVAVVFVARDSHGLTTTNEVLVTVSAVNAQPVIGGLGDQIGRVGQPLRGITFTLYDLETPADQLRVAVESSDSSVVSPGQVIITGTDSQRQMTITPNSARSGVAQITLRVTDLDGGEAIVHFRVTFQEQIFGVYEGTVVAPVANPTECKLVWGDYDGDGDPDLLLAQDSSDSSLYINQGGLLARTTNFWPGVFPTSAAWGDVDGDGALDLLLTTRYREAYQPLITIQWNKAGEFTQEILHDEHLPRILSDRLALTDIDRDGDLDVIKVGIGYEVEFNSLVARIFLNTPTGFVVKDQVLAEAPLQEWNPESPLITTDLDRDGFPELSLNLRSSNTTVSRNFSFRNQGGTNFVPLSVPWSGIQRRLLTTSDFDANGRVDGFGDVDSALHVAHNLGGLRFSSDILVPGQATEATAGDLNNDGLPDLVLAGGNQPLQIQLQGILPRFPSWTNLPVTLTDSVWQPALADVDGDGDLDVALVMNSSTPPIPLPHGPNLLVLRNDQSRTNTPPTRPLSLISARIGPGSYRFSWEPASDRQQFGGLSYNLRVGTAPGSNDVVASMSLPNNGLRTRPEARRLVPAPGNVGGAHQFVLNDVPDGRRLYWSVQAVDNAFVGGEFAPEQVLATGDAPRVSGLIDLAFSRPFSTDTVRVLPFTVTDAATAVETLNFGVRVSNSGLISTEGLRVAGLGTERLLYLRIRARQTGESEIVVRATNTNGVAGEAVFTVRVGEVPELRIVQQGDSAMMLQLRTAPEGRIRLEHSHDLRVWESAAEITTGATGEITWPLPPLQDDRPSFYRPRPAD